MRLTASCAADQPLVRHVDRDPQRGLGGALAVAGLQHPELAALDRELHVLHVAVVALEQLRRLDEAREDLRHDRFERGLVGAGRDAGGLGDVLRRADAGHDVLALGIDQELAVELVRAGRGVAGEGDAGGGGLAHVAEHHGLDGDGRAPALGNGVQAPVGLGAGVHPGREHGPDGAPELGRGLLRERLARSRPAPWP